MAQIDTFLHAIRLQESGNNYHGPDNPSSGASGAYQFTWGTWLEALGMAGLRYYPYNYERAGRAPAWVQDKAARALMLHYYNQFGHSWYNVAEAWYGGPGAVGHPSWGGGPGYPNVGQYASQVMTKYRSLGGSGGTSGSRQKPVYVNNSNPTLVQHVDYVNSLLRNGIASNIAWIQYSSQLLP